MNEEEIWLPCVGYEDKYEVSNKGRVRSLPYTYLWHHKNGIIEKHMKGKIKKLTETGKRKSSPQGYLCTRLIDKNGVSTAQLVHILVAKAFIPNPNNYPTVNHKDGDKHNNCVKNLEWASYHDNNQHAFDNLLRTDNQIIIETRGDVIINIYPSIFSVSRNTGITKKVLERYLNNDITDPDGNKWFRYEPNMYTFQPLNSQDYNKNFGSTGA